MKTQTFRAAGILVILAIGMTAACHIPDLNGINLSGCFEECSASAKQNCQNLDDPSKRSCFDTIDDCFHQATDCSDACTGCKAEGTCSDEDVCNHACVHQAQTCTDLIKPCVESKQHDLEKGLTDQCVGPLMDCVSACVADVEDQLKGKK